MIRYLPRLQAGGQPSAKGPGSGNYQHKKRAEGKYHQHGALLKQFGFQLIKQEKGPNPIPRNPNRQGIIRSTWWHPTLGTIHIDHLRHMYQHVTKSGHAEVLPVGKNNINLEQHLIDYKEQDSGRTAPRSKAKIDLNPFPAAKFPDADMNKASKKIGIQPDVPELQPDKDYNSEEAKLATARVIKDEYLGGGVNETHLVTLADGSKAVFKPNHGEHGGHKAITPGFQDAREAGAWEVAKIAGLTDMVAPAVKRDVNGEPGVLIGFHPNSKTALDAFDKYDGPYDNARAAMFDYVIGNIDRHDGNWLIQRNSKMKLIDHGLAFPEEPRFANWNLIPGKAANRDMTGINFFDIAKPYVQNISRIEKALQAVQLPMEAIDRVKKRIGALASGQINGWSQIGQSV